MKLSSIKYHQIRDYWKNEMSDFSKWLSRPTNLRLLSNEVGRDLELIKTEATKNSKLRVDILVKDKSNKEIIIIENQLEATDFSHLGRIMTYSAIFDSNTIIWIVKDVREEHEKTIDWFNENTKEKISIFLIKLELISIDGSNMAPLFSIICKPKNFQRSNQKINFEKNELSLINNFEKIKSKLLDERILSFFDKKINLNQRYSKYRDIQGYESLIFLLEKYDTSLFTKYNISYTRDLKKDLFLWAELRGFKINQRQYEKTGKRDYKSGGVEFFVITE